MVNFGRKTFKEGRFASLGNGDSERQANERDIKRGNQDILIMLKTMLITPNAFL